jgi:NADH:ubiquinone oxidoreductase subunit E
MKAAAWPAFLLGRKKREETVVCLEGEEEEERRLSVSAFLCLSACSAAPPSAAFSCVTLTSV